MVGTLGTDEHVNLGDTREQEMAKDALDNDIRMCSKCSKDELCSTHKKAWKSVHGVEPK